MKYLLNGVAIAAVLALATPVWAQAPMTPSAGKPAAAAPAPKMAMKQMHHRRPMRHMRMARHHYRHHMMRMEPGDQMTEQLNSEELSRLQGGMAPPPPPPGGGAGQGGPRASGH